MRRLFVIVPGAPLAEQLVEELVSLGVPKDALRLFSRQREDLAGLAGIATGFRPSRERVTRRALAGAAIGVGVAAVLATGGAAAWVPALLPTGLLGGAALGVASAWRTLPPELLRLREEMDHADVALLVDLPDARLGEIEEIVKARHPEIRVKGTDPSGTPPFP